MVRAAPERSFGAVAEVPWADLNSGYGKCDPIERVFSAGHERKDSPTEVLAGDQVVGWRAVQLGSQLRPKLVSRIRVEPSAEVQPLQAVVGVQSSGLASSICTRSSP